MNDAGTESHSSTDTADSGTARGAVWRTNILVGLGSVADIAAVTQLITSGSRQGILVAGLLSVLAGLLGLIQLFGRPVGLRAMMMVILIGTGAGVTGAMIEQYLNEPADVTSAATAHSSPSPSSSGIPTPAGTTPAPRPTPSAPRLTPSAPRLTPSAPRLTPSAPRLTPSDTTSPLTAGEVLYEAEVSLKDQDYLDAETGKIGEVRPNVSDLWYVSPYRALWTAGGGALPITPIDIDGRPDSAACADALATHDYGMVEVGKMKAGDWACARTAEDNLLAVQVRAVPVGDAPLEISYVVWRK
ncbi:hypothetical protein OG884_04190 [Streptosporangium sp. NBC_01755]|uniref:hypothetical protein n=1 Tax=unclassified Streptosporangium TaxID=2632669 RepID=UPI002DDB0DDE|nr:MULTISPECIES: hypothetical protein [unclassified Streptosporangium]WSA27302.1 hypothetical protein OIE13_05345 [Streptosporangium sp. NBC_01810]WSD01146.1 hypothetical protein OG884_04190 [Streptosporangium sp. NBC_01755]